MKVLLVADLHLRHDRPTCRLDDWMESQRIDLENIGNIANEKDVEQIWLLGDIFHRPVESPEVVNMFLAERNYWEKEVWAIAGNHDLKYHNAENLRECSYTTLVMSGSVNNMCFNGECNANHFGEDKDIPGCDIVCTHQLVFPDEKSRGLAGGKIPEDIDRQFPHSSVFLMGDYHEGWERKIDDNLYIMVGCMNIQSAKLKDYRPHVVIFDTETYEYELVYLPQDHVKVTDEHLVIAERRDERLENCMATLQGVNGDEFDFIGNLKEMVTSNNKLTGLLDELIEHLGEA